MSNETSCDPTEEKKASATVESRAFKHFLPLTGVIPHTEPYAFYLELIATRARELLQKRTESEVVSVLDTVAWMLQEAKALEGKAALKILLDPSSPSQVVLSDTRALRLHMMQFDIDGQKSFKGATWGEYFAIVALVRIGLICELAAQSDQKPKEPWNDAELAAITSSTEATRFELLLEAAELVSAAEMLSKGTGELSRAGRKGGQIKVRKYDALKKYVRNEWLAKHQSRSNRDAARRIWEVIPPDLQGVIRADEPEKRLEIWIGKWRKGVE